MLLIGKTTNSKNLTLKFNNIIEGEIPIEALASKAPIYDREWSRKNFQKKLIYQKNLKRLKLKMH